MVTQSKVSEAALGSISEDPDRPLSQIVWRLIALISNSLSAGDVAALRRLRPQDAGCPAFWRLMATEIQPQELTLQPSEQAKRDRRWATILTALALLDGLTEKGISLGKALARADYSEIRFERLLRSEGANTLREILLAARFLAAKGQPVNPIHMAYLAMTRDPEKGESLRREIARHYYRALVHQPSKEN